MNMQAIILCMVMNSILSLDLCTLYHCTSTTQKAIDHEDGHVIPPIGEQ